MSEDWSKFNPRYASRPLFDAEPSLQTFTTVMGFRSIDHEEALRTPDLDRFDAALAALPPGWVAMARAVRAAMGEAAPPEQWWWHLDLIADGALAPPVLAPVSREAGL